MHVDPTEQRSAEIETIRRGRAEDRRRRERVAGFATDLRASMLASTERLRLSGARAPNRHDASESAHTAPDSASSAEANDITRQRDRARRPDDDLPSRRDARSSNADDARPGGMSSTAQAPAPLPAGRDQGAPSFTASELTPHLLNQIAERCVVDQSPLGAVRVRIDFTMPGGRFGMDVLSRSPGQVSLRFRGRSVPLGPDDIDRIVSRLARQGIRVVDTTFEQDAEVER